MGLNELSNQSDISLHNMRFGLIRSPEGSVLFWDFKPWVGNGIGQLISLPVFFRRHKIGRGCRIWLLLWDRKSSGWLSTVSFRSLVHLNTILIGSSAFLQRGQPGSQHNLTDHFILICSQGLSLIQSLVLRSNLIFLVFLQKNPSSVVLTFFKVHIRG